MGIPKQASIAESSGILFCVFQTQALRALHSRMEYFQEDNCVVFAEWKQKKEVEDLALMTIYSVILCFYAAMIYFAIFLEPDCAFLDNRHC